MQVSEFKKKQLQVPTYEVTFYDDFQTLWKGRSEAMIKQFVVPPMKERQVSTPWTAKRCVEVLQKPF